MRNLRRLRETGEIVEVIAWTSTAQHRMEATDRISYIDSDGVEHFDEHLNYYYDTVDVDESAKSDVDTIKNEFIRRTASDVFVELSNRVNFVTTNLTNARSAIAAAKTLADELEKEGLL